MLRNLLKRHESKKVEGPAVALLELWLKVIEGISEFNSSDHIDSEQSRGVVGEKIIEIVKQKHVL